MSKKQPLKFKLRIDVQCGVCGSISHFDGGEFPKFCACCGGAMERFCLNCHKKADMFFEEWWPGEEECIRTYSPAKRCPKCNSILEGEGHPQQEGRDYPN